MTRRWCHVILALSIVCAACGRGGFAAPVGPKVVGYEPGTMVTPPPTAGPARATIPELADLTGAPVPAPTSVGTEPGSKVLVAYRVENRVRDGSGNGLAKFVAQVLADERSWRSAGFEFVEDPGATFSIVLAEPADVDRLCLPLKTGGEVSCQNGPVVAINADRWRTAIPDWDKTLTDYRTYVVNHEVGHLVGMRHPAPQCPVPGAPNSVMSQQTRGLAGCAANWWPLEWELDLARQRPAVLAPLPSWAPGPPPRPPGA